MELLALVFRIVPKPGAPMEGDFEVLFEDDYLPAPSSQYLLSPHEAVSSRRIGTTSVLSTIFFPRLSMILCLNIAGAYHVFMLCVTKLTNQVYHPNWQD